MSDPKATTLSDYAHSFRAAIAGGEAAKLISSSAALFEGGGKLVLSEGAKQAVRQVAERGASRAIAMSAGPILASAGSLAAKPVLALTTKAGAASVMAKGVGKHALRAAGTQVLKGAGKAAGIGFVLDGAVASVEAIVAVRNGSTDRRSAAIHVVKEATTGAIATGAGVLLGAGIVALTGGLAAPVVFAVGALGSIGTKRLLRHYIR